MTFNEKSHTKNSKLKDNPEIKTHIGTTQEIQRQTRNHNRPGTNQEIVTEIDNPRNHDRDKS